MKLTNPTLHEINAAVAEKVAKLYPSRSDWDNLRRLDTELLTMWPRYSTSADAVLSLLEKFSNVLCEKHGEWRVSISDPSPYAVAEASTLPLAACIALLRAHGVEVVFTK